MPLRVIITLSGMMYKHAQVEGKYMAFACYRMLIVTTTV